MRKLTILLTEISKSNSLVFSDNVYRLNVSSRAEIDILNPLGTGNDDPLSPIFKFFSKGNFFTPLIG